MPMTSAADLPSPGADALRASEALAAEIRAALERAGGWLDFASYMQLALYAPGLGYYSGGSTKLGASGDFVTSPELSGALGRALATTLQLELEGIAAPVILELGAGSGALAAQILDALAARGDTRAVYRILEPSAELRERQRRTLQRFGERVAWLERLPDAPFDGAIVANEVADALPVTCFVKRSGRARPLGVELRSGGFAWAEGRDDPELAAAVESIERELDAPLAEGYRSEICRLLPAWIGSLAASLARGSVLLVDYGLTRREYYHPQRSSGTLICHYRHRAHDDPFVYPGLQDISAWVDFSACAAAASAAGLAVAGFTTQAQFLLGQLAAEPLPAAVDAAALRELAALKTLLLPGEMGERFKVLLLRKGGASGPLPGRDMRGRL
ncbi:MAG TPA: SAM-dependent methyltransferase [Gammaproteobacteria bacterium]|nr:SAM-dependent methyltransferase [Gammaproteobacteria bacterium]